MTVLFYSDVIEENGKTVRQNNLTRQHEIPIGTLVEFEFEDNYGPGWQKGTARMYVVAHTRDCDGTPLYAMGRISPANWPDLFKCMPDEYLSLQAFSGKAVLIRSMLAYIDGYPEDSLKMVDENT